MKRLQQRHKSVKTLPGLVLVVALSGCQSTPRHFDGAVGYTFSQQNGQWTVSYTDEATHDWSELESKALAACASETGKSVPALQLTNAERSEFMRNVPVSVVYPAGVVVTQSGARVDTGASIQDTPRTFTQAETVTRRLAFRRVTATCQAG